MPMVGSPICLVNRTGEELKFTADGQHFELKPGDNYGFLEPHAYFAMAQNPLMGSEDYYTLEFQSLVGVKGKTPCEPLSDEVLLAAMDKVERFNRDEAGLRPTRQIKLRPIRGRAAVTSTADLSIMPQGDRA